MASFLDKVFADFDEKAARRELDRAMREVQAMQDTLTAYSRWREQSRNGSALTVTTPSDSRPRTAGGRAVVRELIRNHGPDKEWRTADVREALGLAAEADHGIQVALSRMYRAGELVKPRQGVYKLPPTGSIGGEEGGAET